jgi:hypothetical protein
MLFVFIMVPPASSALRKSCEYAVQASRAAGCDQAGDDCNFAHPNTDDAFRASLGRIAHVE